MQGRKLLNPLEQRMVGCVCNKAANDTCSRDVSNRITAISEIELFVTLVNRGVLRIFTNMVKFSSQLQVSQKKHCKQFYILTDYAHVSTKFVRCFEFVKIYLRTFSMCLNISFISFLRSIVRTFVRAYEKFSCM